jgi:hypothetical protein
MTAPHTYITTTMPFLPDAAARITSQCTPRDGRLPAPSPVFRRLAPAG